MNITRAFLSGINDCEDFSEALDIVRRNSSGKIWLIGGFVYRTIISELYGTSRKKVDLDFVVEDYKPEINLPEGWRIEGAFDNNKLRIVNGAKQIDCVSLKNNFSIKHRKLKPSIGNFLTGAPLTIQSIAYDIDENKIIGEIGIDALKRKVVAINNKFFADYSAKKEKKSIQEFIADKSEELSFTPVFP